LKDSAITGAALSATTTLAILAASANENDGCWGAINNVSHIVDGDDVTYGDQFLPRESAIGVGINAVAMGTWALIYTGLFRSFRFPKSLAPAIALTIGAYITDYYIVPKQYTPGIEKKISRNAIYTIYGVMALTLALAPLWKRRVN
jgi:hypothetical protein